MENNSLNLINAFWRYSRRIKEKIVNGIQIIRPYIKFVYSIISVISTLAIFSALVIFLIGKTKLGNVCDDDLTMQRIKKQLPDNLTISDIYMEDIHGLGNDSIIVLAVDNEESEIANKFLIFDKIENDILNQFNNLFGYGSNYKLSYTFSLEESSYGITPTYYPDSLEIVDTVDLTGDLSKEIVVKFLPIPNGNAAIYEIGIFSYSYETHKYRLLGTYPPSQLYDVDGVHIISTIFHDSNSKQNNYYDKDEKFQLEYGDKYFNDFFIDEEYYGTVLVRANMVWGDEGYHDPHRFTISVFKAIYDADIDELKWEVLFSEQTDEYIGYCTQEYAKEFIENKRSDWNIKLR